MEKSILIVEDDNEDLEFIQQAFDDLDYKDAGYFTNAYQLLTHLQTLEQTQLPALIVTDYNMPSINGFSLVSYIKRHATYNTIKLVVMTGHVVEDESRRLLKAGVEKIYAKPDTIKECKSIAAALIQLAKVDSINDAG